MSKRRLLAPLAVATLVAIAFQGCGKGFNSSSATSNTSQGTGGNPPPPSIQQISIAQPAAITTQLGLQEQVPLQISGNSTYSGTVNLSILESELSAIDTAGAIKFSFNPAAVTISPGVTATSTLTVTIGTMAPSFAASLFHIQANDSAAPTISGAVSVPLQVQAIFDVYMFGPVTKGVASPETFSLAPGSITKFISHSEGLTVRFHNMDSEVHLVHSSGGPIPHESVDVPYTGTTTIGLPPSPDGGKTAGGIYTNVVKAGTVAQTSQVYCHLHEGGKEIRTLQFNVPIAAATPPPPINNPDATFTYINTSMVQAACINCHSSVVMDGGVDLSSYASVLAWVAKDNPSISPLYVDISGTNPPMPKGGPPLAPAIVQDVSDWITIGAPND